MSRVVFFCKEIWSRRKMKVFCVLIFSEVVVCFCLGCGFNSYFLLVVVILELYVISRCFEVKGVRYLFIYFLVFEVLSKLELFFVFRDIFWKKIGMEEIWERRECVRGRSNFDLYLYYVREIRKFKLFFKFCFKREENLGKFCEFWSNRMYF